MTARAGAAAFALAAIAVLAALFAWQGESYADFSDGVYAATARLVADGADLYGDVAAAQPPPLFLAGAGILELGDSASFLRATLALCSLASAALVAACVVRLTGRRAIAAVAGLASLLLPWQLREHATLVPETFAAPLLMASALLASRERGARTAGLVAALASLFKLAYLAPAAAIGLAAAARRRFAMSAAATFAVLAAAFLVAFGGDLVDNVVTAQRETGTRSFADVVGYWGQAAWNTGPLLALAALAWPLRRQAEDPALLRTLTALALSSTALLLTTFKDGTYINLLVVVEPPVIALAAAAASWLPSGGPRLAAAALAAVVALQSVSFLADPNDPALFARPGSDEGAHAWPMTSAEVEREAERAMTCPPGTPYSGEPWVAFVADRGMPGNQPDTFIINKAETHADLLLAAQSSPRCP